MSLPVDPATLAAFAAACLVIYALPGPDMAYIGSNALAGGRRAGLLAAIGTVIGAAGHATAAALGISVIFAASPLAFAVVKWAGVAYLAWLGWQTLRAPVEPSVQRAAARRRPAMIVAKGAAINLLNPKVALFFLSFLPQFTDPATGGLALQLGLLGAVFVAGAAFWCAGLALVFAWAGHRARVGARFARWQQRVTGVLFLGFAGLLAFER